MPRRDQLTYDVGQPRTRGPVPWLPLLLLVAVLAVVTVLVASLVGSGRSPEAASAPGSAVSTGAGPTPSASATASSALPSGSDADEGQTAPEGSQQAAAAFVRAWLDPVAKTRQPALAQVSSPALAEGLMLTDPANIPKASPRGPAVLEEAATYSVQFRQDLSAGPAIQIYLVADPAARYGWLATSVEQA